MTKWEDTDKMTAESGHYKLLAMLYLMDWPLMHWLMHLLLTWPFGILTEHRSQDRRSI